MKPSKQELLKNIHSDMKLTKNLFIRIYGYEITWPGFAEQALSELERAGCSKAREYYRRFVGEYELEHEKELKNVAEWYLGKNKRKKVVKKCKENLQQMSNSDLLAHLESLIREV